MTVLILTGFLSTVAAQPANVSFASSILSSPPSPPSPARPPGNGCFDYYKFGSVSIGLNAERAEYRPAEKIRFVGTIANTNAYPLVDGTLVLRLGRITGDSINGDDILDEWEAQTGMVLEPNQTLEIAYDYQLPSGLPAGDYKLTSYFLTAKKFNLAGLSFSEDIHGGYTLFKVASDQSTAMRFDRSAVKINQEAYRIFGLIPKVFSAEQTDFTVEIPLVNDLAEEQTASVTYSIYEWDGRDDAKRLKTWTEPIRLTSQETRSLTFNFQTSDQVVLYAVVKAVSPDQKSEVHIRLVKEGFRPRLGFLGLDQFPIKKGQPVTLMGCYHNSTKLPEEIRQYDPAQSKGQPPALATKNGKIELTLFDKGSHLIDRAIYEGQISGRVAGLTKTLTPPKNFESVRLVGKVFDDKNRLVDQAEVVYDCQQFSKQLCATNRPNWLLVILGSILLALAVILRQSRSRHHFSRRTA